MPLAASLTTLPAFNPVVILQGTVIAGAAILLFLLLFTLRDILLRTKSFWYQGCCVLLVGALPIVGFLVYLLIRPARTVKERELDAMLRAFLDFPTGDLSEEMIDDEQPVDEEEISNIPADESTPPSNPML